MKGRETLDQSQKPKLSSKAERRQAEIMRILVEQGDTQLSDLVDRLGVSLMTIHRDLNFLQAQGLVRRIRGAVSVEKSVVFESSYFYRSKQNVEEKRALAEAAVAHIEPGNAIVWDDSSTTYHVCDFLESVTPVTVLTNALPVINRLHTMTDVDLIGVGGKYHTGYGAFFGMACEQTIRSYHVDIALMSSTTIQDLALYTQDEQVVGAKRAMIAIASKKLLLIDSSKFHYTALSYVADLAVFDVVLVSRSVEPKFVDQMSDAGIAFEVV